MALLTTPTFLAKWAELAEVTPWATGFQRSAFVNTWYEHYGGYFEPVVVLSESNSGDLLAMMTLAWNAAGRTLVHAGAHQAEYQAWLARPRGEDFFGSAINSLEKDFPWSELRFKYLPPGLHVDALLPAEWQGRVEVKAHQRPLLSTRPDALQRALSKKANKSRYNRLKRIGDVVLQSIGNEDRADALLQTLALHYDLRQGAANDTSPFRDDSAKMVFVRALVKHPEAPLHFTALVAGEELLAGHIGMKGRGEVHLSILAHSPIHAKHSPGKLIVQLLSEQMHSEGYGALDLTPGGDPWKERFADRHDEVQELILYRAAEALTRKQAVERAAALGKRMLARLGFTPDDARAAIRAVARLRIKSAAEKIRSRLWEDRELRVYRRERDATVNKIAPCVTMQVNAEADLLQFSPSEPWQNRQSFLSGALARMEEGEYVYTYAENGLLLHYGWTAPVKKTTHFSEVEQDFTYPGGSAVLYDFFTHPIARGRGIIQASINQMLVDLFRSDGVHYVYISALATNESLIHVIEKLNFQYQGSLYLRRVLGLLTNGPSSGLSAGGVPSDQGRLP